ncbi:BAR-domain-containing protein [Melanogaster broomeanus]|nr:BAR-domain-containing protein [Melanogaster broomeanus]
MLDWGGNHSTQSFAQCAVANDKLDGGKVLQKTGQIERTVDREFADEESKYRAFEKECQVLQKDSKTYGDAVRAMTGAQARLSDTITTFYGASDRTSEGAMAGHAFKSAIEDLDGSVQRELDAPYRTCIQEPLGKINAYFPVINEHYIETEQEGVASSARPRSSLTSVVLKLLDYDAARSKLRKVVDKPSEDPTKLPKAQQEHDDAKEVFEMLNDQLVTELPQLLDSPRACKFAEDGYEKMGAVQRYFPDNVRDDYAAGQLDAQV